MDRLIAIVGETASGKSGLALTIAERWNGEIIAADSRTVYKGMDIGTAKPTPKEQAHVPHHVLDVVAPNQRFNASDFKQLAVQAIADIQARGKLPILVGGTGLYVDAILYDFQFRSIDADKRAELEQLSVNELQQKIIDQGLPMPNNKQNSRHLVRTLETNGQTPDREALRPNTLLLGLRLPRNVLEDHIKARVDNMIRDGLLEEVASLVAQYGWDNEALKSTSYRAFHDYIKSDGPLHAAKEGFVKNDLRLAKRQRTWFRRNPDIIWCDSTEHALKLVDSFLH